MLIGTAHGTVFACRYPDLVHRHPAETDQPFRIGGRDRLAAAFAGQWEDAVCALDGDHLLISRHGRYLCAAPDGSLGWAGAVPGEWERFRLIHETEDAIGLDAAALAEIGRFERKIAALREAGEPVRIQFGALWSALPGFLNIDIGAYDPGFIAKRPDEYFVFPYVGVRIPVPDGVADYIYHEDFIEHIDQLGQLQFLAETRRLLRPGGIHRVNTPDLDWIMRRLSDFDAGAAGVYSGERRWGHVAMMTRASLAEAARLAGYGDVRFTARGESGSPHRAREMRPVFDRDPVAGNLYADLVK